MRPLQYPLTLLFALGLAICPLLASAQSGTVYWTDRNGATVSATDITTNATAVLVPGTGGRLQDVDLDAASSTLYFADWGPVGSPGNQGTIRQVPKTGGAVADVCGTGTLGDAVHQLALDPAIGHIYFTRGVSYDGREVSRVNYGPGCTGYTVSSVIPPGGWFPSGLAYDPANDILYWGDPGVLNFSPNGSVNQMTASTLSGGTQLTPHVNGRGRAFALDPASQTIFLTAHTAGAGGQGSGGTVHAYDIVSGTETQIIPASGVDPDTGYWDIEIDPVGQRIWFTAVAVGEVRSANFDGSDVQVELSGLTNPYGLALDFVYDSDGDGVLDDDDLCEGTVIPEAVPTRRLNPNHWALVDGDFAFDTVTRGKGNGPGRSYTTTDTGGCSCEQIIDELDLGNGHRKHGCSISAMDDWVAIVSGGSMSSLAASSLVAEEVDVFALDVAAPNPFTSETTLAFEMPEAAPVTLTVYDLLGRTVRVLADGEWAAGRHEVRFDAGDLPSGTYLYRLDTPRGPITRTMVLLR